MAILSVAGGALTHRLGLVSGSGIEMPKEGLGGALSHPRSRRRGSSGLVSSFINNRVRNCESDLFPACLINMLISVVHNAGARQGTGHANAKVTLLVETTGPGRAPCVM